MPNFWRSDRPPSGSAPSGWSACDPMSSSEPARRRGRDLVRPPSAGSIRRGRPQGRRGRVRRALLCLPHLPPRTAGLISRSAKPRLRRVEGVFQGEAVMLGVVSGRTTAVIVRESGRSSCQRRRRLNREAAAYWVPAFAGMTSLVVASSHLPARKNSRSNFAVASGFSSLGKCPESTGAPVTFVAQVSRCRAALRRRRRCPASPHKAEHRDRDPFSQPRDRPCRSRSRHRHRRGSLAHRMDARGIAERREIMFEPRGSIASSVFDLVWLPSSAGGRTRRA